MGVNWFRQCVEAFLCKAVMSEGHSCIKLSLIKKTLKFLNANDNVELNYALAA